MLLALDTSTRFISIALHDGQTVLAERAWRTAGQHTVELAPSVDQLLRQAGLQAADLRAVAVALGPGSYTGLRIGLGLAHGLALAGGLALLGVPSLDGLMCAQPPGAEPALGVLQVGRGRLALGEYHWQAGWQADGPARLSTWAALAAEITAPTYICGEIEAAGPAALAGAPVRWASPAHNLRRASFLAEIAWERLRRGAVDDPAQLKPIYAGQLEGAA